MYLRYVTITGVDSKTDIARLNSLSEKYPFVEWGFLYSPSRAGNENRYMNTQLMQHYLYSLHGLNLSLHLCGKGVNEFLDRSISRHVSPSPFQRIQLNFNEQKPHDWTYKQIISAAKDWCCKQIITQDNANNRFVTSELYTVPNRAMLWDSSGGTGSSTNILPPDIPTGVFYGFAGGINPENVRERLILIEDEFEVAAPLVTWVDMESGVRTDDWLDLDKVEAVLNTVYTQTDAVVAR